jgi:microcystin-dependent protein
MSQPYIGEIRMFPGNFAPSGWSLCQGQVMSIADNDALFTLIGTTYGGDGQTTFNLPNLQSRVPIHMGGQFLLGQMAGVEQVTLTTNQLPAHTHTPRASAAASTADPTNAVFAGGPTWFAAGTPGLAMDPTMISPIGGSQPHDNMVPFLTINFIISLFGVFPSQN